MGLAVNVICRNFGDDRVIPRFARYLRDGLGYTLTARPLPGADLYYLSAYFEIQMMSKAEQNGARLAAYFTHKELEPPGNSKAKLFEALGARVELRIATAARYAAALAQYGDTAQITPPVERGRFTIPKRVKNQKMRVGFSGFTYANKRKGENIARALVKSKSGRGVEWCASGRGWPVQTFRLKWSEMPRFYQSLDVLVVTATVEGVPMPPLEVLACGGSIVIPRGVGLLDELPDCAGIYRYPRGSTPGALEALEKALAGRAHVNRAALREITAPYSITAWCEQHRQAFEELFS